MTKNLENKQLQYAHCPVSQGNQTIKVGQLIKNNMRNIFLEKSYTKYGEETIPRPFSKTSTLSIFLNQLPEVLHSLLLFYANLRAIEIYRN